MLSNYMKIKNEAMTLEQLANNAGNEINKSNVLKNSDIAYACINYISSTIAKMPITLYKEEDDGDKTKVNNELSYLIKNRPSEYINRVDFIQTMVSNMLIYGNSFAKICTRSGKIHEFKILDPSATRLEKTISGWCVTTTIDNKPETLNYNQVIHLKDLSLDGVNGMSRIEAIRMKLENKKDSDKLLADFIKSGGAIGGILSVTPKGYSERENIKKEFNTMLRNDNPNKIAVVPDSMTYTNITGNNLADAEFINNLKITKEDIMAIFNINPALLGMSEKATNSNMIEMIQQFIQSLIPLINKIEMEFNYKLLSSKDRLNHFFKFNMSSAMRATDLDRADYLIKMVKGGLLTRNEARELDDRNKVEGGDELLMSLNYVPYSRWEEYLDARSSKGNGKTANDLKGGE